MIAMVKDFQKLLKFLVLLHIFSSSTSYVSAATADSENAKAKIYALLQPSRGPRMTMFKAFENHGVMLIETSQGTKETLEIQRLDQNHVKVKLDGVEVNKIDLRTVLSSIVKDTSILKKELIREFTEVLGSPIAFTKPKRQGIFRTEVQTNPDHLALRFFIVALEVATFMGIRRSTEANRPNSSISFAAPRNILSRCLILAQNQPERVRVILPGLF